MDHRRNDQIIEVIWIIYVVYQSVMGAATVGVLGFVQNRGTVHVCDCTGTMVNTNLLHLHLLLTMLLFSVWCARGIHSTECPLVLLVFTMVSFGRVLDLNLKYFVLHNKSGSSQKSNTVSSLPNFHENSPH